MILYTNESGYELLNSENELWKGRNFRDTKYFSGLLRIMSERTRNLNFSEWQSVESVETVVVKLI